LRLLLDRSRQGRVPDDRHRNWISSFRAASWYTHLADAEAEVTFDQRNMPMGMRKKLLVSGGATLAVLNWCESQDEFRLSFGLGWLPSATLGGFSWVMMRYLRGARTAIVVFALLILLVR